MTTTFLPGVTWITPSPVAPQAALNGAASPPQETQAQVAAENAPLRVIYGRARLGAQVADVLTYQNNLVMVLVWGDGEIHEIESIAVGDAEPPAGIQITHHYGTAGQTADATLVAAYASHGITFADALPGIAYTVASVPAGVTNGVPTFAAIIKGRKLYDPRKDSTAGGSGAHRLNDPSTWEYSDNPALALADFIRSTVYGMGKAVDAAGLIAAADYCDELVGTAPNQEKRRTIGLVLDKTSECTQWLDTLRTYAGCFVSPEGSSYRFIPDKPGSVTTSFGFDVAPKIKSINSLQKKGVRQVPTVMEIRYTDTGTVPWSEKSAIIKMPGVDGGTTPRRESQVALPGVTRYSQAVREATERLNKLTLCDLSIDFFAFDEALKSQVGDIVDATHPIGLTAKQLRVMNMRIVDAGRWQIAALEYDPAAYSDTVTAEPTWPDTALPDPAAPPAVTGVTMSEEVFQMENGIWSSRWRITWSAATYPYLDYYRAELWAGASLIQTATRDKAEWATTAVQEGINYTAKIAAVSDIGSTGTWATQSALAQGKQLIPGDVPSVTAFEAGGTVYGSCTQAADIDIWRYEWRYWTGGGAWETGTLIDRVDSLRIQSDQIPVGTWVIGVKAMDSVKQYSANAATCNVTVTSDAAAFLVNTYDQTNPALTNMAEYSLARTDANRYFVTEDGVMAATKFPNTASTYGNIAATYHNSGTSTWLGEAEDFGQVLGGQWTGSATVADLSGSHISYLGNSTDGSTWNYPSGLSQKVNSRFARMKHEALTTGTLKVTIPAQSIRVDAIPREEVGTGTSSASGAVTITLTNPYVACKKLTITPQGTTARSATFDNIVLGNPTTFDVYVFNDSGTKIASPFRYEWQGV